MIEDETAAGADTSKKSALADREATNSEKPLPPAAERALAEAAERRAQMVRDQEGKGTNTKEVGGRKGLEPTRYGDWEKGGIVSDF